MDTMVIDPAANDGTTLSDLLQGARDAMRRGRFHEAEAACGTIVETHPDQPDASFLLGLAALRNGNHETAVLHLERAADMRRGCAPYRIALGQALIRQGDAAHALRHFEDARLLDPRAQDAVFGQASALNMLGRKAESAVAQKEAFALLRRNLGRRLARNFEARRVRSSVALCTLPGQTKRRNYLVEMKLGRRHEARNDYRAAIECFERAHAVRPTEVRPVHALGRLYFEVDDFPRSRHWLEKALELDPQNMDIRCDHARTLSRMALHDEALRLLEDVHDDHPDAVRPLLTLGWARYRAGQSQRAIGDFDKVLEVAPRSVEAHYGRARALVDAGQIGDGKRWLRRTLALDPAHAGAIRELAIHKELTPSDSAYEALQTQLGDPDIPAQRRAVLHMAAGAAHINAGSQTEGFSHWQKGNALKDVVFDIEAYTRYADGIRATFDDAHFERTADWGNPSDVPVFVLGMPRSGTSLVEQILASHSKVHGAGEREEMLRLADGLAEPLNDTRAYPDCLDSLTREKSETITRDFLNVLRRADPHAARIIDKMPGNFHHVGLIATLFPKAKIIHCIRDPRDTCLSIFFGDFVGSHPYSYDLTNLGRYYRQYERLMQHWHDVLPGRVFDIHYEDLIEDQEGRSRELVKFCGLDWETACLDFHKTRRKVRTRSNAQVRQPIYRSSMGRWRTYADELKPLTDALAGA